MVGALSQQVEQILDEHPEREPEVIVRLRVPDPQADVVSRLAIGKARQRRLAGSGRDLLNQPRPAYPPAGASAPVTSGAVRPLLTDVRVRRALRLADERGAPPPVQEFWTSHSALLRVPRDDLAALAAALPGLVDIHFNRHLPVPDVLEVADPPDLEEAASSWGVRAVGALAAWGAYGARGAGVTVGVLDTGVDASHPDLAGKIAGWAQFDGSGSPVAGSQPHDSDRHGTHVAGTIVGGNASGSWIGVAPEAKVAVAMVLNGASGGTDAQVLAGFDWAVEQGVDVLSLSLGGLTLGPQTPSTYSQALITCLQAGIPVVTAIGNDGAQTSGSPGNDPFAFSVGATDLRDEVAGFSGGRTHIVERSQFLDPGLLPFVYVKPDVSAPGVAVRSSVPGGTWASFNGTSMAAPHVTGALALLLGATRVRETHAGPERAFLLTDLLAGTTLELGEAGLDARYGFGRINVLRALNQAKLEGL